MEIDWNSVGTLKHTAGGYDVRTGALRILVTAAMQGYEGDVSGMHVEMEDGTVIAPGEIRRLALVPGRIRWQD
ncbi:MULTISPECIES: hypothetical protein [Stenotrophomonas]|uniref:hypothetical protein n=1 Tax=Stenotrophomonas TaxID=40323 RepID=UPI000C273F0E|nr:MULTISPECIES: hypothetical protein [Stenotrophomonas]MBD3681639.1 hypothetical protein [Stenotrophomonas sp. Br8]PJO52689.1 hypothetical protein CR156_11115 [Stenotrophomonas lactitubi]